ncbi:MerR family transcriptional regulator [Tatumella citrea]|uniref:Transcriptional regulator n=1 Tax=Tatumella citrea TaxID=53336 RepID=A0A1Y0LDL3_TATCI|nr:MerR family transcriptional regulator [Tatumella citrea]ARU96171.1 transcriptional regulator [Tatumella citrea]ARV00208.1 transcriptional regulator [Tatumella citrea]
MLIGELAAKSGVSRDTIRYYQRIGLIGPAPSNGGTNNYRCYTARDLTRLGMIRHARALGFSSGEITEVIVARGDEQLSVDEKRARLQAKLEQVEAKAIALAALESGLRATLEKVGQPCEDDF